MIKAPRLSIKMYLLFYDDKLEWFLKVPTSITKLLLSIIFQMSTYNEMIIFLVNCQWAAWSEWTSCSSSCGSGTRKKVKTRAKNDGSCIGNHKVTKIENCIRSCDCVAG